MSSENLPRKSIIAAKNGWEISRWISHKKRGEMSTLLFLFEIVWLLMYVHKQKKSLSTAGYTQTHTLPCVTGKMHTVR